MNIERFSENSKVFGVRTSDSSVTSGPLDWSFERAR